MQQVLSKKENYIVNLDYLYEFVEDNNIKITDRKLKKLARAFSSWEEHFVFTLPDGYESFRETVVWLDYDEILEMLLWTSLGISIDYIPSDYEGYRYFLNSIYPEIKKVIS